MATQSPSALRPVTPSPAASKASRTSRSRSTKIPDATSVPPGDELVHQRGRQRDEQAGDQVRQDDSERPLAAGSELQARPSTLRVILFRCAFAIVASMAIGSVSTPNAEGGTQLDRGDGQDGRAPADIEDPGTLKDPAVREPFHRGETQPGGGDGARSRTPSPDRARAPRRWAEARWRRQVGTDHDPSPDAHDREVRLPGIRPIRLVHDPCPQLADRTKSERLEVSEGLGGRSHGTCRGRAVARGHVGAHGRGSGHVNARAQTLVLLELERRLDRCATRARTVRGSR